MIDLSLPSPIQRLSIEVCDSRGVKLWIKRDDLIHPAVNGNKYRKLKYNLLKYREGDYDQLITFGGAFSNHIHAVASAGKMLDIDTVGVIRGKYDQSNPTLHYARQCGMRLHFVDRSEYRMKEKSEKVQAILHIYPNHFLLPEGGTNEEALMGCQEMIHELEKQLPGNKIVTLSAGTGGTAAGVIKGRSRDSEVIIFSSLKGDFIQKDIAKLSGTKDFKVQLDYHFGGYGKTNETLISFINQFYTDHGIVLDPIYNGKGLFGLLNMIEEGHFEPGTTVVWLLTGGQQGNIAWNYMNGGGLVEL